MAPRTLTALGVLGDFVAVAGTAVGIASTSEALLAATIIVIGNLGLIGCTGVAYRGRVRSDAKRGDVA